MEFTGTHYLEPIDGFAEKDFNPHCGECPRAATHWLYPTNSQGRPDLAAAKPVCMTHTTGDTYGGHCNEEINC